MHSLLIYLTTLAFFCFKFVQCSKVCDLANTTCITSVGDREFKKFLQVKSMDPFHGDEIITETPSYKYELYDPALYHLGECEISLASYDVENNALLYVLFCPRLVLKTSHSFKGDIANVTNLDEKGSFTLSTGEVIVNVSGKYKLSKEEGKSYIVIKHYDIDVIPKGKFKFEDTNLTQGDEQKAKDAMAYLNEKGQELTTMWGIRWITELMDLMMKRLAKYILKTPVEKLYAL